MSSLLFATAGGLSGPLAALEPETESQLRVIAYNVYGFTGFPEDRELARRSREKKQIPERIALELALYNPSLVTFSESDKTHAKTVARKLNMNLAHFQNRKRWPWPGSLMSKYPILKHTNKGFHVRKENPRLFTRHWGTAKLKVPGLSPLLVHSVHLHPSDAAVRKREIRYMLDEMASDLNSDHPLLVMGDLNHPPDTQEYRMWTEAGLIDTYAHVRNERKQKEEKKIKHRIDYVMASGPVADRLRESKLLTHGAFRGHTVDSKSFSLSDHPPALATFRLDRNGSENR